jgi:predicted HAD superfamily Cof-like phosphohydrolase
MSDNSDVKDFQTNFEVPMADKPTLLDPSTFLFRSKFMQEELNEFNESHLLCDLEGCADALVDLVYVAHGTALMMGIPWQKIWDEVQRANMSKVRATSEDQSKRKSTLDVIKPEGWIAPDHKAALGLGATNGQTV